MINKLLFVAFSISLSSAGWAAGPANKATGDITTYQTYTGNCGAAGQFRQVEFNAHEATARRPAKGVFTETVLCTDGTIARYFEAAVIDVCVFDDGSANFLIKFTYDSFDEITGRWDQMTVRDMGEPGIEDVILRSVLSNSLEGYDCLDDATGPMGDYAGGNIQVHYR